MDDRAIRKQCLRRLSALKTERASWIDHWRDISDMILPRRGRFLATDRNNGARRNTKIIDNTGTMALRTMSAGLMSGITSPARPWFSLQTRQPGAMEDGEVKVWLGDNETLLREILNRSNAYDQLGAFYEELVAFGIAAMLVYEDFDDVINCETLTAGQYCVAPNRKGEIDTLYREYSLTVGQLVDDFAPGVGDDRDFSAISESTRRRWEKGQLDDWVDVIQAIEPNPDYRPGPGPAERKRFRSVWIEAAGKHDNLLRVKGFDEFPAMVGRWNISSGDIYATAPAMDCLGDVEQLQSQEKDKSLAIQKMVKPPLNVPSSLKADSVVNSLPNGTTFYDATAAAPGAVMATPLYQVQPRLAEMQEDMNEVRQRINNAFFVDLWLMISQMERSGVTATEIDAKREEKLLILGPVLERLHHDVLNRFIDRMFAVALRAGIVPPPPRALAGQMLQVRYTSMLAQAQRAVGTGAIERLVSFVGNLAAANQAVLDKVDLDQAIDEYADAIGAPARIVVPDDRVAQIRDGRAQQVQQQQAMQSATLAAQNAQVLSKTDTGGRNALTDILGNVTGAV